MYTVKMETSKMDVEQYLSLVTKIERRELLKIYTYKRLGHENIAARGLSALIRAAKTTRSRDALMTQADILDLSQHPEFIV
jgi:hypothetical protein